jgi:hypothetical protein
VRRVGLGLLVLGLGLAGVLAAAVLAGTDSLPGGSTGTDTTAATEPPPPTTTDQATTAPTTATQPPRPVSRKPALIASGVRVGKVVVAGLTRTAAEREIRAAFARPLVLLVGRERLEVPRTLLGAVPYIEPAVSRALTAKPGTSVGLAVALRGAPARAWLRRFAKSFDRKPIDARVRLRDLRPAVSSSRVGRVLRQAPALRAIFAALSSNRRAPLRLPIRGLRPAVSSEYFGPVIVIRRSSNHLYLYKGMRYVRRFGVATGQASYPTPLGRWQIVVKARDPWWFPPDSPWAAGEQPIPPGPGNPLGTRWMGLSAPGVGIHGTPDAASIGYSASHGCIRMLISDAEWLFNRVQVGTTVFVVSA